MILSLNFFQKKYTLGGFNLSTQTGFVKKRRIVHNNSIIVYCFCQYLKIKLFAE